MKSPPIDSDFKIGDAVQIVDPSHMYHGLTGVVDRIGAAGWYIFTHIRLQGIQTVITFYEEQVKPVGWVPISSPPPTTPQVVTKRGKQKKVMTTSS